MPAQLLDGRALAATLREEIKADLAAFAGAHGVPPSLAVVQVEGDAASTRYVASIRKLCASLGVGFRLELLPADTDQAYLEATIAALNADDGVDGVLLQLPLPAGLSADAAIMGLDYRKDVDGVHPVNAGLLAQGRPALVPNTPAGGMELLRRNGIEVAGLRAAVVGRSPIVGRPMTALLIQANATVTVCHTRTRDLAAVLRECELVVVAAGRAGLVTGEMLRPGACVVDFGTNVLPDGRLVGDVAFESAVEVAGAITPVPGGTGPVTNVMLLRNLLAAARARRP